MPNKKIRYELILLFERDQFHKIKQIFERLPKGYCTLKTLYNYHAKWKKASAECDRLRKFI